MNEEDKKILERFPKYKGKGDFVGTRDYWKGVFHLETNRDPELHEAFSKLHTDIVNMVIRFCKEHNLTDVDEFVVGANGLMGSCEFGEWCPCTDSSMSMRKFGEEGQNGNPFLFEI